MPTLAELIKALPEDAMREVESNGLSQSLAAASLRPVPVGRLRRVGLLGTLQAKIAAANALSNEISAGPFPLAFHAPTS